MKKKRGALCGAPRFFFLTLPAAVGYLPIT